MTEAKDTALDDLLDTKEKVDTSPSTSPLAKRNAQRSWYESNKERLSIQRRERYRNDPEYRQRIKEGRERQRAREKEARKRNGPKRTVDKRRIKEFKVEHPEYGSCIAQFYSIGQLGLEVGLSVATLRRWERTGVLPATLYRSEGGHRLYTDDQVAIIAETYQAHLDKQNVDKRRFNVNGEFSIALKARLSDLILGIRMQRFVKHD
jgi:hypothetical protein